MATATASGEAIDTAPAEVRPNGPVPGQPFGPYVILARIGAGGMGVVLRARDPALGRDVALKVLRADLRDAETRLLAEARAMARLAHPNVVTVYDAGEIDGQVYLAMELVDGLDVRAWRAAAPRSVSAILDVYLGAGRGLAAAHQAGLIHRDFKPDNIIVGPDGRARVTDFGIAAHIEGETAATSFIGTPRYMAPEQHDGRAVDARADQFSFCVSLWESLHGARPFPGKTRNELRRAIDAGVVTPPGARVPAWIRAILTRGLKADPDERFPSMTALLDALAKDPGVRRRRLALTGGLAAATGLAVFVVMATTGPRTSVCAGAAARLDGVWDKGIAERVRAAFTGTGRPYAADTFARVAGALDAYRAGWVKMHTEACEATSVRGEQSPALLDLRMACLEHRRGDLAALTGLFVGAADAEVLDRAVQAVARLEPLSGCADTEALTSAVPLPAEPELRAKVVARRKALAELRARRRAGKSQGAVPAVVALVEEARTLGHAPLVAEALEELVIAHSVARDHQAHRVAAEELLGAAARAKDDRRIAQAQVWLAHGAVELGRPEELFEMRSRVEAAIARAGDDPILRAQLAATTGRALRNQGDLTGAITRFTEAIAILERAGIDDAWEVGGHENSLGVTLRRAGRFEAARVHLERAASIYRERLGPGHPSVSGAELNIANLESAQGKLDAARRRYLAVLTAWTASQGADGPDVALVLHNLGELSLREGKLDEARGHLERSLAIKEKRWGKSDRRLANTLMLLGALAVSQDRGADAGPHLERVLAIADASGGRAQPDAVDALLWQGQLAHQQGDPRRMLALAAEVGPLIEKTLPADNPRRLAWVTRRARLHEWAGRAGDALVALEATWPVQDKLIAADDEERAITLTGLGVAYLALGRAPEALPLLERAVAFCDSHAGLPFDEGRSRMALARALAATGGEKARIEALVAAARADLAAAGARAELAELARWRR